MIATIASQQVLSLRRQRILSVVLVSFVAMTVLAGFIGWQGVMLYTLGAGGSRNITDQFTLDLTLAPTQPLLLQGEGGYSRKGPRPAQASGYYSEPHLAVSGTVTIGTRGDAR